LEIGICRLDEIKYLQQVFLYNSECSDVMLWFDGKFGMADIAPPTALTVVAVYELPNGSPEGL
jgi:hypothetical protein